MVFKHTFYCLLDKFIHWQQFLNLYYSFTPELEKNFFFKQKNLCSVKIIWI